MNLDPRGGRHIAARILVGLVAVDPANKAVYEARHAAYAAKLDAAEKRWAQIGAAWKGTKWVEYHQEFRYFASANGAEIVGALETKPGIPPTPNHLAELMALVKRDGVKLIVTAPWSNNDTLARFAEKSGATIVELPNMCGGAPGAETWIGMIDVMYARIARVLGGAPAQK